MIKSLLKQFLIQVAVKICHLITLQYFLNICKLLGFYIISIPKLNAFLYILNRMKKNLYWLLQQNKIVKK